MSSPHSDLYALGSPAFRVTPGLTPWALGSLVGTQLRVSLVPRLLDWVTPGSPACRHQVVALLGLPTLRTHCYDKAPLISLSVHAIVFVSLGSPHTASHTVSYFSRVPWPEGRTDAVQIFAWSQVSGEEREKSWACPRALRTSDFTRQDTSPSLGKGWRPPAETDSGVISWFLTSL